MKATHCLIGLGAILQYSVVGVFAVDFSKLADVKIPASSLPPGPQFGPVCPVQPKPEKKGCGIKKEPIHKGALIVSHRTANTTDCAEHCLKNKKCESFTWTYFCGVCKLYSKTANKMAIRYSEDGTLFYNRDCWSKFDPVPFLLGGVGPVGQTPTPYALQAVTADTNDTVYPPGYNPAVFTNDFDDDQTFYNSVFILFCDGSIGNLAVNNNTNSTGLYSTYIYDDSGLPPNLFLPSNNNTDFPYGDEEAFCNIVYRNNTPHADFTNSTLHCSNGAGNTFFGCEDSLPPNSLALGSIDSPPAGNCTPVTLGVFFFGL